MNLLIDLAIEAYPVRTLCIVRAFFGAFGGSFPVAFKWLERAFDVNRHRCVDRDFRMLIPRIGSPVPTAAQVRVRARGFVPFVFVERGVSPLLEGEMGTLFVRH